MKPITKVKKISKKYIVEEIKKLKLPEGQEEILYNFTLEEIRKKRLFFKDIKCITYFIGKNHLEIAFYTKDRYFRVDKDIMRI